MFTKIKNSTLMKPAKKIYKCIKKLFGIYPQFENPSFFLNNQKGADTAVFILAGYKSFTWDIVFKRIKLFCPKDFDVCIVSSGVYSDELLKYAKNNNWSYISMKRNCVTLALNSAIKQFSKAENIFKLDEDIFITENFFCELPKALVEASKEYKPGFAAPIIPINGYGYRRLLEKLNLCDTYANKFEYPKISAGIDMQIESNPDVAKFFWGEGNFVPHIDSLNNLIHAVRGANYTICPIRFSIGAIFFKKNLLEQHGFFPVRKGNCMGLDEGYICNLATTNSKVIVVSEKQVCGHLSFGKQNSIMKEYFLSHKDRFDIQL